ncbi:hypothetical protein NE237_002229 [Protea cynaroides]|uniref:Uncharacterized protein n=1 Tax=Protea cynaroides TaxID=273540 RepID=A0A9Q0KUL3_9MAGN|nr:hypothetical protein NE237_002229 [Protea cynaroides]
MNPTNPSVSMPVPNPNHLNLNHVLQNIVTENPPSTPGLQNVVTENQVSGIVFGTTDVITFEIASQVIIPCSGPLSDIPMNSIPNQQVNPRRSYASVAQSNITVIDNSHANLASHDYRPTLPDVDELPDPIIIGGVPHTTIPQDAYERQVLRHRHQQELPNVEPIANQAGNNGTEYLVVTAATFEENTSSAIPIAGLVTQNMHSNRWADLAKEEENDHVTNEDIDKQLPNVIEPNMPTSVSHMAVNTETVVIGVEYQVASTDDEDDIDRSIGSSSFG